MSRFSRCCAPYATLTNPFPTGVLPSTDASLGLSTFLGRNIIFSNPDRKISYVHSYSFGVQHQLPFNVVIDASYVGSRTIGIDTNSNQAGGARNLNVPTVAQLNQLRQDSSYFNAQDTNPFAGLLPGISCNCATISRRQLLLPYPQFGSVQEGARAG